MSFSTDPISHDVSKDLELPESKTIISLDEIPTVMVTKKSLMVNDKQISGSHRISWDGKNENGNYVPTGFYFCTLEAGDVIMTRKMALLK